MKKTIKTRFFRDYRTEHKLMEEDRERLLKELKSKSIEFERFISLVSHELRQDLGVISNSVYYLRYSERNDDEKAKVLKMIENATIMMGRFLVDILEFARIGCVANPPEDVPLGELIQEALEQTGEKIKISRAEVSVADDFPVVHVDRRRIVEVLVNLIENSINYIGEQLNPKIDIGYRLGPDTNETVFFVRDNGIGIDPNQHRMVFDLFWKTVNSKGTGAGLAIVKRIIEVHDGRIWIESEKGKGCTVCFTLPVHNTL